MCLKNEIRMGSSLKECCIRRGVTVEPEVLGLHQMYIDLA